MKTVIQQLMQDLKESQDFSIFNNHHVKHYLDLEKKQIEDAYWAGLNGAINDYSECKDFGDKNTKVGGGAEKYYKDTFNQIAP